MSEDDRGPTTVHVGPLPEVLVLQAALGAEGFDTYIPDANMKAIDPFITGGNIFFATLQARASESAAVSEAIARLNPKAKERSENGGIAEAPPFGRRYEVVEALGRRL